MNLTRKRGRAIALYACIHFSEESIMTLTYIDDVKREVERSKRKNKEIEEKYDEKCKALQVLYLYPILYLMTL